MNISYTLIDMKFIEKGMDISEKSTIDLFFYPLSAIISLILIKFFKFGRLMQLGLIFSYIISFIHIFMLAILINFKPEENYWFTMILRALLEGIREGLDIKIVFQIFEITIAHSSTATSFISVISLIDLILHKGFIAAGVQISKFINFEIMIIWFIIGQLFLIYFSSSIAKKCDDVDVNNYRNSLKPVD